MSLRRFRAITRKEFRHVARDARTLFLVTISPALLLFTLSYIFSFDVEQAQVAVMDLDRSPTSRRYLESLTSDGDLIVTTYPDSYAAIDRLILAGRVALALVIPPGFGSQIQGGRSASVQAIFDGMDPISASQTLGQVNARSAAFVRSLGLRLSVNPSPAVSAAAGGSSPGLSTTVLVPPLKTSTRHWYNPAVKALFSMVPGLLAVVLSLPALALALAVAREKEMGTLEGLMATPARGGEFLMGKLMAYVLYGILSALLAWGVAVYWFHVPFRGSVGVYILLVADYYFASMGLGLLIANFVRSQQTAMIVMLLVFFVPSFFLSGLVLPVDPTSLRARLTSVTLPATHFVTIGRALFLKGLGLVQLRDSALILALMGTVTVGLSLRLFKKRL
jgi:ABC-type Na+ efflux pump permease subunit